MIKISVGNFYLSHECVIPAIYVEKLIFADAATLTCSDEMNNQDEEKDGI